MPFAAGAPGCVSIATATIPTGLHLDDEQASPTAGPPRCRCTTTVVASSAGLAGDSISVTVSPEPGDLGILSGIGAGRGRPDGWPPFHRAARGIQPWRVIVRVTSSDAALLLVSPQCDSGGAAFVDVPLANGNTDATYYMIAAVEGARGTVTLTATAPGLRSPGSADGGRGAGVAVEGPAEEYDDVVARHAVHPVSGGFECSGHFAGVSAATGRGHGVTSRDPHNRRSPSW